MLAVAVFGFLAAKKLPIELLPDISYPTLTVQTVYKDAAPQSVERFVTRPIEEAISVISGVRAMRSVSRSGLSEVILEFEWGEEMDFLVLDVREKLGLVELPREASLPRVLRYDPSLDPIVRLAFRGGRPLDELRQIADRELKARFEAVEGVASAKVRGGLDPEIQVEVDEDRLTALGLTLEDLASALRAENINRPGGTLKDWGAVYLVRTLHEFEDLEQIRRTVIRDTPQGRVRVEDVAEVRRGHRDREEITRHRGEEAVEIALHREGSTNTIAVARAIHAELELLRGELADDLSLELLSDQSTYIAQAVSEVKSAAILGGVLAVLVLFFFLRDPLATLIIALTIPVSVVATFLPLASAGVSLNIMSLGGLALGVGMLVDNSIVVLEAIDRHRKLGKSRMQAAIAGAGDVAGAVTAATLTTVSVFLPIIFVQGVAGQLFYDLSVTVCLSLLASLVVSLTLIPSLSGLDPAAARGRAERTLFRWDRESRVGEDPPWTLRLGPMTLLPVGDGRHWMSRVLTVLLFLPRLILVGFGFVVIGLWWMISWSFAVVTWPASRVFEGLGAVYPRVLRGALRLRHLVVVVGVALFVLSVLLVPRLGTALVPELAQGEFAFQLRLPEGTPLETTGDLVARLEEQLRDTGRFSRLFSVSGSLPRAASGRQTLGENLAQIDFVLPKGSDALAEASALEQVREVIARFPNIEAEVARPSVLALRPPVVVNIFSDRLDVLERISSAVRKTLEAQGGIRDVAESSEPGSPEIRIELDRERAASLGVNAEAISRTLRRLIHGEVVGKFREDEERLDIRLRASNRSRDRAALVGALRIPLPGGRSVPVSAVATVHIEHSPAAIHRLNGARVAQVTAQAEVSDLGQALAGVRSAVTGLGTDEGAVVELGGQDADLKLSLNSLKLALALAVFMVYVVMAMQFESIRYPLVILFSVPLGAVGVVFALLLTRYSISVLVLIGVVMLAGIVVNNAIVLVDAITRRRRAGEGIDTAIVNAGSERLRPILMTTTTTVLALLPMALGLGAGTELRAPMAVTVIGGLTISTLLTLIVIPSVYRLFGGQVRPESE